MTYSARDQQFGCEHCWPADAAAAWKARSGLSQVEQLIDESHFHVMILACPECDQPFVSVFTETIDWRDGEDPQYWTLLPITETEVRRLVEQRNALSEKELNKLGSGRRCLQRNHPKDLPPQLLWGSGMLVGPHD
jgi:hypothetical protein